MLLTLMSNLNMFGGGGDSPSPYYPSSSSGGGGYTGRIGGNKEQDQKEKDNYNERILIEVVKFWSKEMQ